MKVRRLSLVLFILVLVLTLLAASVASAGSSQGNRLLSASGWPVVDAQPDGEQADLRAASLAGIVDSAGYALLPATERLVGDRDVALTAGPVSQATLTVYSVADQASRHQFSGTNEGLFYACDAADVDAPTCGANPAISLNKTVGTVPGACATTDTITVTTGTEVYYCYVAENTGDVTFNFHNLVDDQLGSLLNQFPYSLAPGDFSPQVIVTATIGAPTVNTATWTALTNNFAYTVDDTIPYSFEDIAATGTAVVLGDEEVSAPLPLGFSFDFFGMSYTDIRTSSNGFLTVNNDLNSGCCTGLSIPTAGSPDGLIAGWWEDLNPVAGGTIHYETLGTAPNRHAIIQFTDIQHYLSGNPVTFQYKLFESSNVIEVHYQDAASDGGTHSAGLENQDGTAGIQFYLGTAALPALTAVRYTPEPFYSASASDTATVHAVDPDIAVSPTSLTSTQPLESTVIQYLTINNIGMGALTWNITEENTASAGGNPERQGVSAPVNTIGKPVRANADVIQDGGFEAGTPNPFWNEASTNFGTPLCTIAECGLGGGTGPHSGSWWAWFGGIDGVTEAGSVDQNVTIPEDAAILSFWLEIPAAATTGFLNVEIDGNVLATYTEADQAAFSTYQPIALDVSAYADGGTHNVAFVSTTNAGTGVLNFFVDDVALNAGEPCLTVVDYPWLSVSPTSGATDPSASTVLTVTLDSAGLVAGTYTGSICVNSNDPDTPTVAVPVALVVEPALMYLPMVFLPPASTPASLPVSSVPAALPVLFGGLLLSGFAVRRKQ